MGVAALVSKRAKSGSKMSTQFSEELIESIKGRLLSGAGKGLQINMPKGQYEVLKRTRWAKLLEGAKQARSGDTYRKVSTRDRPPIALPSEDAGEALGTPPAGGGNEDAIDFSASSNKTRDSRDETKDSSDKSKDLSEESQGITSESSKDESETSGEFYSSDESETSGEFDESADGHNKSLGKRKPETRLETQRQSKRICKGNKVRLSASE